MIVKKIETAKNWSRESREAKTVQVRDPRYREKGQAVQTMFLQSNTWDKKRNTVLRVRKWTTTGQQVLSRTDRTWPSTQTRTEAFLVRTREFPRRGWSRSIEKWIPCCWEKKTNELDFFVLFWEELSSRDNKNSQNRDELIPIERKMKQTQMIVKRYLSEQMMPTVNISCSDTRVKSLMIEGPIHEKIVFFFKNSDPEVPRRARDPAHWKVTQTTLHWRKPQCLYVWRRIDWLTQNGDLW